MSDEQRTPEPSEPAEAGSLQEQVKGEHVEAAREYLTDLAELVRLPDAEIVAEEGGLEPQIGAPRADLNIIPLPDEPDFDRLETVAERLGSPCLFTRDSGKENALA